MQNIIVWKRAKSNSRVRRIAGKAFRVGRNIAAVLGVCFVYFLVLGYVQYRDQLAEHDVVCAVSRCM